MKIFVVCIKHQSPSHYTVTLFTAGSHQCLIDLAHSKVNCSSLTHSYFPEAAYDSVLSASIVQSTTLARVTGV